MATCPGSGRGALRLPGAWTVTAKLLLDPYAKAIDGRNDWNEALFSYRFDNPEVRNDDDSAP